MPWTGKTFAAKHNHALKGKMANKAASIASAIVRSGGDEGVAIATANKYANRHRALGGILANPGSSPFNYFTRQAMRHIPSGPKVHMGPIGGHTMGRGDKVPMHVAPGSYVLPADHVSGLGQGNTQAGFKVLNRMFSAGPMGAGLPHVPHGGIHMPRLRADGGGVEDPIEIQAADGEYVIPPEAIMRKFGDLKKGHKLLDDWVVQQRAEHVKKLKSLPGPVKE